MADSHPVHYSKDSSAGDFRPSRFSSIGQSPNERDLHFKTVNGQQHGPPPSLPSLRRTPSHAIELPPLPRATNLSADNFPTRLAGVSSILNPSDNEFESDRRRRKSHELKNVSKTGPSLPPLATSEQPSRRQSPSVAASVSPHFSQGYLTEGGYPHQMPVDTAGAGNGSSSPKQRAPEEPFRKRNSGAERIVTAPSASASPSTSYSSYSRTGPGSPGAQLNATTLYARDSGPHGIGESSDNVIGQDRRPIGIPISSSGGQNTYQMMTLETTSGTVQLPVDVQAASRVADEKRRRNAGASARFRQRRKEKEKEASTTIARLEQQMKELSEDADFYKRERDYMASVILQASGAERHFPRPSSPRRRRSSAATGGRNSMNGSTFGNAREPRAHSPDEGRNVRRRTSLVPHPPPGTQSVVSPAGMPMHPSYAQQNYGTPIAPHPPHQQHVQSLPQTRSPLLMEGMPPPLAHSAVQRGQTQGLPPLMQAPPQTGPWNPYAAEYHHGATSEPR
ncbi:hypothetical protein D0865_14551 [Hortaea werneckii]|uniref:BZIP domain-containing protein n=1 Tax=Hortaea werneckii TaxID=91943 RepID=A0A3M7B0C5_HORWE|nr:hypothetical protein D0865_14551 [Hortaea werneckii]